MITYVLIFGFCTFMLFINDYITRKRDKEILAVITLILLCFISGTRYYLGGSDYYVYKTVYDSVPVLSDFFKNYSSLDSFYTTFGFERGYLFLNSLVKTLGFNFFGFTTFHSIVFYSCLFFFIKRNSLNYSLVIIVFLYKLFFYNTFISMRQSLAIAIFLVSIEFIKNRKFIKYYLCVLLCLFLHTSSIILLPLYFLNRVKLTKGRIIVLNLTFIPTLLVNFLNIPLLGSITKYIQFNSATAQQKAADIASEANGAGINAFHIVEYFIIMLFVILFYEKIIKVHKDAKLIILLFLMLLPIYTLFSGYEIVTRVKDYFTITYGIIIGYWCTAITKYSIIIKIVTITICLYGYVRFLLLFDNGGLMPYNSYIFTGNGIFGP